MSLDAATAKAFLMKKEGGSSVYDHLQSLILKLVTEQPDNALASIESLSASLKAKSFPDFGTGGMTTGAAASAELDAARAALLAAQAAVFKAPVADEETGAGGPGAAVQNLTEEGTFLEWAGVGLGATETFRTHLALKALAAQFPATGLRFWGKLLGRGGDYVVAEGVCEPAGEEADDEKDALGNTLQKTGDGPNKFTYFVCSGVGGKWTRLPRVTPHAIIVARQTRRLLTGSLSAPVATHPPFPGDEALYVRALIALISAGTTIAPAGVFTAVEGSEEGAIEANAEEFDAPDVADVSGWVHTALDINELGRTRPNPAPVDADGNPVEVEGAPEASAPLKPISDDAPVDEAAAEGGGAWAVATTPASGLADGETPSGPVVVRSLRWPGAVAVGLGKKFVNAYVGWGQPVVTARFQPSLPPTVGATYNYAAEETRVVEKADVTVDNTPPPDEAEDGEE